MSSKERHNDDETSIALLNTDYDMHSNGQTENGVCEPLIGKDVNRLPNPKKKLPRNLVIVEKPVDAVSGPRSARDVSFAGGMPRTPLTPSTIFNFELPHSPGLPSSPAYVEQRQRTFSFNRVSIPPTVEEVSEDSEIVSKNAVVQSETPSTNWKSVWIMGGILFLVKMQFAVYYASVWPFLQEVDSSATTTFYGFMTASYSLGAALSAPLFGYWSNKMRQIKIPAIVGLLIMLTSNLCFMLIELVPKNRKYFLLIARLGHGVGMGASILLQTYSAIASTNNDKSTAAAISDGAYCLGIAFGPVFQLVFAPLGHRGIGIGPLVISMYTAPAYAANGMIVLALLSTIFVFRERHAIPVSDGELEKDTIALCILIKFVQMFMYSNLETVGSPYSMIVFKWTRSQAAQYNSAFVSATGFLGFAFLAFYVWTKIGRRLDNRIGLLVGLILCLMFQICTYPWKLYSGKIYYRDEITPGNVAEESVGCPRSFEWCSTTPAINVYFYNTLYVFLFGIAFPLVNVHLAALFCAILGPRRQGTMQGINILISSLSRVVGPVLIMELFNNYGPKVVWLIEGIILTLILFPFFLMYKRMVPLKTLQQMVAGDKLKYKNGYVYRF
ncbi:Major facilitator superfamily domain-containing protein 8 [Toxocara canis]|uniref:Major facilitator superfamily domain-containing protein 8 n=1 Tax=Toxocara canis TaxID=6265 RepID=A0A0B2UX66_TOXCA|nr:Major facilitator superfamily domain-containing protein 8 [Toxocara canis]